MPGAKWGRSVASHLLYKLQNDHHRAERLPITNSQIDFSSLCVDAMFSGLLVDCNEDWSLRAEEGVLVICDDKIIERAPCEDLDKVLERYEWWNRYKVGTHRGAADPDCATLRHEVGAAEVRQLSPSQFLMPGLIDTHIHASQVSCDWWRVAATLSSDWSVPQRRGGAGADAAGLAAEVHLPHGDRPRRHRGGQEGLQQVSRDTMSTGFFGTSKQHLEIIVEKRYL